MAHARRLGDRFAQTRVVRLLSVFALNRRELHRSLGPELQAFCLEFARVKEAAALYRQLKALPEGAGGE